MKIPRIVACMLVQVLCFTALAGASPHGLYAGFAQPVASFGLSENEITFSPDSGPVPLDVVISDDAVYRYGYMSLDGQAWKQFNFTGDALGGSWLSGSVAAKVELSPEDFNMDGSRTSTKRNFVVAYSCFRDGGSWDCHEGWQIWQFNGSIQHQEVQVVGVSASSYDTVYAPENTLDGDPSWDSRWSAEGDGEWISYELSEEVPVDDISISAFHSNARNVYFSIEASVDGSQWNEVYDGGVTVTAPVFYSVTFPEISARYLRLVGHGSNMSDWNSYTEVRIEDFPANLTSVDPCAGVDCSDGNACTADSCSAGACSHVAITSCAGGDSCCPPGCTSASDGDCEEPGSLLAFPGAVGFGKYTRGAYAGSSTPRILIVDSLSDSSTGSETTGRGTFRWTVTRSYPRIILFEVSGYIDLESPLSINSPYVTIAGQSAPSPGITLRYMHFQVYTHDVIVQHMRSRLGNLSVMEGATDAFDIYKGPNTYVDHCSFSWGTDENVGLSSTTSVENVTVSNCIISEALYRSDPNDDAPDAYGMLIMRGTDVSIIGNLFAHLANRAPLVNGLATDVSIANNLLYNTGAPGNNIYLNSRDQGSVLRCTIIGNKMIPGPDSRRLQIIRVKEDLTPGSQVYLEDNEGPGRTSDPWSVVRGADKTSFRVDTPPISDGYSPVLSQDLEDYILPKVGARPADRDAVDERVIGEVESGTGSVIDYQDQVGGWPPLAENTRPLTSIPGYPSSDPHGDDDSDGYTNIEEWLYEQAMIVEGL